MSEDMKLLPSPSTLLLPAPSRAACELSDNIVNDEALLPLAKVLTETFTFNPVLSILEDYQKQMQTNLKNLIGNLSLNINYPLAKMTDNLKIAMPTTGLLQTSLSRLAMSTGLSDLKSPLASLAVEMGKVNTNIFTNLTSSMAEQIRSINSQLSTLGASLGQIVMNPVWADISDAREGNKDAAARLAVRIHWYPNKWQKEAIRLRARISGQSPEDIRKELLTQGVLNALSYKDEDRYPVQLYPQSTWVHSDETSLMTICPDDLPTRTFWEWFKEEVARAAELTLIDTAYAPSFVVVEPPVEYWDLKLAKFTSLNKGNKLLKGRPFGSCIFENRDAFLNEVRIASERVKTRGNKITQERVAEMLSEKGLLGMENPERQLRRWTTEFGFNNWSDLHKHI